MGKLPHEPPPRGRTINRAFPTSMFGDHSIHGGLTKLEYVAAHIAPSLWSTGMKDAEFAQQMKDDHESTINDMNQTITIIAQNLLAHCEMIDNES